MPSGASSTAARSAALLYERSRRLPAKPKTLIGAATSVPPHVDRAACDRPGTPDKPSRMIQLARQPTTPAIDRPAPADAGFGLYVHWPFCRAKCPYCDFNSHVAPAFDEARFAQALLRRDRPPRRRARPPRRELGRRPLDTIFFGGGTPSLMAPATVAAVIERATARFAPGRRPRDHARGQPDLGRGREAPGLPRGRRQPRLARRPGARRRGAALPRPRAQRRRGARRGRPRRALVPALLVRPDLRPPRPDARRLAGRARPRARPRRLPPQRLPAHDRARHAVPPARAHRRARDAGRRPARPTSTRRPRSASPPPASPAYEISNHARPGEESRHNLIYWRSGAWAGIGPGAHGRLDLAGGRVATEAWRLPKAWLERVVRERLGRAHPHAALDLPSRPRSCW